MTPRQSVAVLVVIYFLWCNDQVLGRPTTASTDVSSNYTQANNVADHTGQSQSSKIDTQNDSDIANPAFISSPSVGSTQTSNVADHTGQSHSSNINAQDNLDIAGSDSESGFSEGTEERPDSKVNEGSVRVVNRSSHDEILPRALQSISEESTVTMVTVNEPGFQKYIGEIRRNSNPNNLLQGVVVPDNANLRQGFGTEEKNELTHVSNDESSLNVSGNGLVDVPTPHLNRNIPGDSPSGEVNSTFILRWNSTGTQSTNTRRSESGDSSQPDDGNVLESTSNPEERGQNSGNNRGEIPAGGVTNESRQVIPEEQAITVENEDNNIENRTPNDSWRDTSQGIARNVSNDSGILTIVFDAETVTITSNFQHLSTRAVNVDLNQNVNLLEESSPGIDYSVETNPMQPGTASPTSSDSAHTNTSSFSFSVSNNKHESQTSQLFNSSQTTLQDRDLTSHMDSLVSHSYLNQNSSLETVKMSNHTTESLTSPTQTVSVSPTVSENSSIQITPVTPAVSVVSSGIVSHQTATVHTGSVVITSDYFRGRSTTQKIGKVITPRPSQSTTQGSTSVLSSLATSPTTEKEIQNTTSNMTDYFPNSEQLHTLSTVSTLITDGFTTPVYHPTTSAPSANGEGTGVNEVSPATHRTSPSPSTTSMINTQAWFSTLPPSPARTETYSPTASTASTSSITLASSPSTERETKPTFLTTPTTVTNRSTTVQTPGDQSSVHLTSVTDTNAINTHADLTIKPDSRLTPEDNGTQREFIKPPSYLELKFAMSWPDFCTHEVFIRGELVELLQGRHEEITADQIQLMNVKQQNCREIALTKEISVQMYLVNKSHNYDRNLTFVCAVILKSELQLEETSIIKNKLIDVRYHDGIHTEYVTGANVKSSESSKETNSNSNPVSDPGVIIAIVLAVVGGCCCIGLIIIQIIIRRRHQNSLSPGLNRSSSVTSFDSIQLSSVNKSRPNSGLFNPGLDLSDPPDPTHPLNLMQLSNFCMYDNQISTEYQKLPNRMPRLSVVPAGDEDKNRYANILPLVHTRVKLQQEGSEPRSSYINASYVTGPNNQCQYYIATQAPTAVTVADFWTMVWQQGSKAIIMLTQMEEDGQSKCMPYWPELAGKSAAQRHGDFLIELKHKDVNQEYIASRLEINNLRKIETRQIDHFWYTCWPSIGMPEPISLVKLVLDTRPKYESSRTPLIVHCSPGTGRTGTFIALDLCMHQFETRRMVDVMKIVHILRQERAGAIQNKEQYALLYHAVLEYATIVVSPVVSAASSATTLHALLSG